MSERLHGNTEIFITATDGNPAPTQLTDSVDGDSLRPDLANNGRVVFESTADLTGNNSGGSSEIFGMESDASGLVQITDIGNATMAAIAGNGSRIAFQSTANPDEQNSDGSAEIFIVNSDGENLQQLTASGAASAQPSLSDDGARVAFQSSGDLSGNNPDANGQIFVQDPASGGGNGNDNGNANDGDDPAICNFAPGCSECSGSNNSNQIFNNGDGNNIPGNNPATNPATGGVTDPTLSLLVFLGLVGVARGRRK